MHVVRTGDAKAEMAMRYRNFYKMFISASATISPNSDFHNVPSGGWDNHRTSDMDFIARTDNRIKKGKRPRRHSNLWANMTCNLLSCEKHKWWQHCDFFFQDTEKLIASELLYLLPMTLPDVVPLSSADLQGLIHPWLSRGRVWLFKWDRKIAKASWPGNGPFTPQV